MDKRLTAAELLADLNDYILEAATVAQVDGWLDTLTAYGAKDSRHARQVAGACAKLRLTKNMLGPIIAVERIPKRVRSKKRGR